MAQNFRLSPTARALPDGEARLVFHKDNEGTAYLLFMAWRWKSLMTQVCPKCGAVDSHRPRPAHKQWRCNACRHDFSAKSGSLFEGTKLPYAKLLEAMYLFSTNPKGMSAVQFSIQLGVNYETGYLLQRKFRFALMLRASQFRFTGAVEIDCVWLFKHQRPLNVRTHWGWIRYNQMCQRKYAISVMRKNPGMHRREARRVANEKIDIKRRSFGPNPNKRPVFAIVERDVRGGVARGVGFLVRDETFDEIESVVKRFVERGTVVHSDGASAYSGLNATYETKKVEHKDRYSAGDGQHTNFVESFFSRWRRTEKGTYHRLSHATANEYFAECFWREEFRHTHPVKRFLAFVGTMMSAEVCTDLKKYGRSQVLREQAPRKTRLRAMPLPIPESIDRLCALRLLSDVLEPEAQALKREIVPQPSFSASPSAPKISSWDRRPRRRPDASFLDLRTAGARVDLPTPSNYQVRFALGL